MMENRWLFLLLLANLQLAVLRREDGRSAREKNKLAENLRSKPGTPVVFCWGNCERQFEIEPHKSGVLSVFILLFGILKVFACYSWFLNVH